jgi:spore coat polysaccharide biosynthesis protein SpsF (cytidylyltransferase family)
LDKSGRYFGSLAPEEHCPLILPEIVQILLDRHFSSGADYTAANKFAVGTSVEVTNTRALEKVAAYFDRAEYSEYMIWYFQNNPDQFKLNLVDLPDRYIRDYRLTLDYSEDFDMFNAALFCVLVNLNRTHLFEIFQTLRVTYRHCSNEAFPGCNTAYKRSHLASYVHV